VSGEAPWYRLLDHTGDIAILIGAPTLPGIYDAATRALFDVILDVRTVEPRERIAIRVEGAVDAEDLLVRYLSELLYLHDTAGWLFRGAEVVEVGAAALVAHALGEAFDPARHEIQREVKAVTYHQLLLSEDREGWSARVVLDL
jgi:SHS2 domain-containing protein